MKRLAGLLLIALCFPAAAAIEKIATPTASGVQLTWWPKIESPVGWQIDEGASHQHAINAQVPDGSTFAEAETVMYGAAEYKPRVPETRSLDALVARDMADFTASDATLVVAAQSPMRSAGGVVFQVVSYSPGEGSSSQWERVAYGDDGDFYITFAISSRTQAGLTKALPAFTAMVEGYQPGS